MKLKIINDRHFEVIALNYTRNSKKLYYNLLETPETIPLADLIEKHSQAVKALEFLDVALSVEGFPHSVAMQARTHRIGTSFDVQSQRYTGKRVVQVAEGKLPIGDVFYFRPAGTYKDRKGNSYVITHEQMEEDKEIAMANIKQYALKVGRGESEEAARDILPQGIRQNFVMSINLRYLIHMLDLRLKLDTQPEFQSAAYGMLYSLLTVFPELFHWYNDTRLGKAILAP